MPFGGSKKKPEKNHPNGSSKPVAKVNLSSKPKDEQAIGTWSSFGNIESGKESRLKAAKVSVASSEGETYFVPDDLFPQDAVSPTKTRKRSTFSSMTHKVSKILSKASPSSQQQQTPLPCETNSGCSDDPTSSNQSLGGDGPEGIVETHTPNSYPTLELYVEHSVEGSEGATPQLDKVNDCH